MPFFVYYPRIKSIAISIYNTLPCVLVFGFLKMQSLELRSTLYINSVYTQQSLGVQHMLMHHCLDKHNTNECCDQSWTSGSLAALLTDARLSDFYNWAILRINVCNVRFCRFIADQQSNW